MNSTQRFLAIITTGAAVLTLANCTVSTPQARIDRNPGLFESLPANHQELARQGRLTKGMSKPAVYLALGNPSRKSEGFHDNAPFERWDYTRLQPRYYNNFYASFGYGHYGYHNRCGHSYSGYGFSPVVEYIPYRSSTVLFRRGVVDSWERLGPPPY
jgi:outer membrane protein assembly factor BamE (lipoprotein component of BamABCDE complex)